MSWIQNLYETYENIKGQGMQGSNTLIPISHFIQQAHVEITLDENGNFISAKTIGKNDTIIPTTKQSAVRTGRTPEPHPLCDKVQYCAADYPEMGGRKTSFFEKYEAQLAEWCHSPHSHAKAQAVLTYIRKRQVVADLVREEVLHLGADGKLLTRWDSKTKAPELFRVLSAEKGQRDQGSAFIRWQVRESGNPCTAVWEDASLQDAWAKFDASTTGSVGVCMVTGEMQASLALHHPKRIRYSKDNAKLISSNDSSGYTFRGRFTDGQQACSVGYEVTQKAHSALRWLIQHQAYRNGDQVIVSWAVTGKPIPDPFSNTLALQMFGTPELASHDTGQPYAERLTRALRGYRVNIGSSDGIVVMGLDSASSGRMAITYYRELKGSEFWDRIEEWHQRFAWYQDYGKQSKTDIPIRFMGPPAPPDIAEAAFGSLLNDKLKKATVKRLLPCVIEGQPLPRDIVESTVRRASQRVGLTGWEWEKTLGIACALFKGTFKNKEYKMSLETDRHSRDYLYGRLLAIAEHIEKSAIDPADETHVTTAAKLMQRFADYPASTWRIIEPALNPYNSRPRAKNSNLMHRMDKLLDEIISSFVGDDFLDNSKLSGEFLLGYHCQRQDLMTRKTAIIPQDTNPTTDDNSTVQKEM